MIDIENSKAYESRAVFFLNNLRSKTSESHKKLELLPISRSVIDPKITVEQYALYLSLMFDIVQNLENAIYPILNDVILDLEERKKVKQILNDLEVTGISKKTTISPFKESSDITIPFAMGMMYVVEGSTLGGRFILKNIEDSLKYNEKNGASYFFGYGNKSGSLWKKYINILTDFENKTNAADEIIEGADYAFKVIYEHLSKNSF